MEHIIMKHDSETMQFSETIKLELSDTEHGAIAIETTSTFANNIINEMRVDRIRQHISTAQALQIIADLSQLLEKDALNNHLASS